MENKLRVDISDNEWTGELFDSNGEIVCFVESQTADFKNCELAEKDAREVAYILNAKLIIGE
jgi:hypothetical protein